MFFHGNLYKHREKSERFHNLEMRASAIPFGSVPSVTTKRCTEDILL